MFLSQVVVSLHFFGSYYLIKRPDNYISMAAQNHFGDQRMQPTAQKIDQLQVTRDTLTSRGGLTFLVKYVEAIGILTLLLNRFAKIKKSVKGVSVGNLFLQALYLGYGQDTGKIGT